MEQYSIAQQQQKQQLQQNYQQQQQTYQQQHNSYKQQNQQHSMKPVIRQVKSLPLHQVHNTNATNQQKFDKKHKNAQKSPKQNMNFLENLPPTQHQHPIHQNQLLPHQHTDPLPTQHPPPPQHFFKSSSSSSNPSSNRPSLSSFQATRLTQPNQNSQTNCELNKENRNGTNNDFKTVFDDNRNSRSKDMGLNGANDDEVFVGGYDGDLCKNNEVILEEKKASDNHFPLFHENVQHKDDDGDDEINEENIDDNDENGGNNDDDDDDDDDGEDDGEDDDDDDDDDDGDDDEIAYNSMNHQGKKSKRGRI